MKTSYQLFFLLLLIIGCTNQEQDFYKITLAEYQDKMKGAWVGQMAGVGWGLPTEFNYTDQIIPAEEVPQWQDEMVNQHGNDDIYVEMTFLHSMDQYGLDVDIEQAGIDFANTGYTLWAANKTGRENLRYGIAPPASSHPQFSNNCDDIDYQIEADYSGIIAPGMPQVPVEMGEKFGRLMNYGDGMYGGQFVGAMYAAAYFLDDVEEVVKAGLAAIPAESHYATCVNDVINWYHQHPDNWQETWQLIEEKYHNSDEFQKFAQQSNAWKPIDAKLNGAYIVLGLLYGQGNMDSTIVISMRGGKDSDCNPSNAAGVLGTMIGFENLDRKYKRTLDYEKNFSYSEYNFNQLINLCENFTRELIIKNDGRIEEGDQTVFYIRKTPASPSAFHPSYSPAPPPENTRYSEEQLQQIKAYAAAHFDEALKFFPVDIDVYHCGKEVLPELISWNGKENVLATIPMSSQRGVSLEINSKNQIPAGKNAWLTFKAGHEAGQSWRLKIQNGSDRLDTLVTETNSANGWLDMKIDLSQFAGKEEMRVVLNSETEKEEMVKNYWTDFNIEIE
ncbi:MAG: ADP-ribosylglycohydrolase family protein [Cyclobacteriaceae bacterium]